MREYGKVAGTFWIGATGKKLRGEPDAQVVALYLLTNPHATMLGLYYLAIPTLVHETGLTEEGARKGLRRAIEAGFCAYDEESEYVWVYEMARFQISDELKPGDKRIAGIAKELAALAKCPYAHDFHEKYAVPFKLPPLGTEARGSEGASEAHRSQEQEQEQEQESDLRSDSARARAPKARAASKAKAARWRRVPEGYVLTLTDLAFAKDAGLTDDEIRVEEAKWRDHEYRDPKSDPAAAWRTWSRNAADFRGRSRGPAAQPQRLTAAEKTSSAVARLLARSRGAA